MTLRSQDDDAIGVMFHYKDSDNYYRFTCDRERSCRRLVKIQGGVFSLLAEDTVPYIVGQTHQVKVTAQGELLMVSIDDAVILSVTDNVISSGGIALYTWGNAGSYFDDVVVERF